MNDLYLELANTQIGQQVFQSLNLPNPVQLKRSENDVLTAPYGSVLIAATKNNFALQNIFKFLNNDSCSLTLARSTELSLASTPNAFKPDTQDINLENLGTQRFRSFIFDATGFTKTTDLNALFYTFKQIIRRIKTKGKIIIVGEDLDQASDAEHSATQGSLDGFCKSIAKEVGKKGIICNLIYLKKGSQKYIQSPLYFLMTNKACYITGQSIKLSNNTLKPKRINWNLPLKGKLALVTGAAQGIGLKTAKVLSRDGATVVCLDMPSNKAALEKLARSISGHSLPIDLSDDDAVENILSTIRSQLGAIDIIIHNAGITRDKTISKMPDHFWNQVIDINLSKVIQLNNALFENKVFNAHARIICISSISGIAGNFGQSNYACSKSGIAKYVETFSQSESVQQSDGLTINAIAPGFIETKMTHSIPFIPREIGRRMNALSQGGLPIDVAESISFFCHPASQAINGNVLRVCGQSLLGR